MKLTDLLIASVYLILSNGSIYGEPVRLSDRDPEEAHSLIAEGGKFLIEMHGEELLDLLYFRPQPTDEELLEATSNPPLLKPRKEDLPVYRALKGESEASLQLLRNTDYFKYPQHLTDLEVIAYFLHDVLGHDGAVNFAEDRIEEGKAYVNDNWLAIAALLERPELASGRFIIERTVKGSTAEPVPTVEQLRKQRMQLKNLLKMMPPESTTGFLSVHLQFRKVLVACLEYRSAKKQWPSSLFSLVDDGDLEESEIMFLDSDRFWYVPRIRKALDKDHSRESVLKLVTPDGIFTIRGFLDGTIDVAQIDRK